MGKCVRASHPNTLPYTSPIPLPTSLPLIVNTLPHSPHTLSHTPPHTSFLTHSHKTPQHTSLHLPPYLFLQLLSPPPTPQHTSPLTPCTLPHSLDYVAKLPCDDVTLINLTGLWKSSIKFFMTTGNLKSCFGVGNANFRCMMVWRSYCGEVTMWRSYWQPLNKYRLNSILRGF